MSLLPTPTSFLVVFLFLRFLLKSTAVSAVQVPLISLLPLLPCATVLSFPMDTCSLPLPCKISFCP